MSKKKKKQQPGENGELVKLYGLGMDGPKYFQPDHADRLLRREGTHWAESPHVTEEPVQNVENADNSGTQGTEGGGEG
jgi:hypothetical protein